MHARPRSSSGWDAADWRARRFCVGSAIATIESQGAHFVEPARLQDILPRTTVAVLSPGVPLVAPLVRRVQDANVPVIGEIELAYRLCKAPIIAVTGTKGKSTTT